jgi:homoserine kinase type II
MGIKTPIKKSQLPIRYQKYTLIPTQNGVMATVYLLDNIYVLKLFEKDIDLIALNSEIRVLNHLENLSTPKVVDRFKIDNQEAIIYTQIRGEEPSNPTIKEVAQIGEFLREFHYQTKDLKINNKKLFSRDRLKRLIDRTKNRTLFKYFNDIKLTPKNSRVIHGDLFIDNSKFIDGKLSGVFDFSDSCLGDTRFDLAVVAISWCFDDNSLNRTKVNALYNSYGHNIDIEYIKYALLYYATTRFLAKRDYTSLLKRLSNLTK